MKKKISLILLVVALGITTLLTACTNSNNTNTPTEVPTESTTPATTTPATTDEPVAAKLGGEVTIWTWNTQVLSPIIPAFNELHPDVKINLLEVPDNMGAALTTIAAGAGAPDVVAIEQGQVHRFSNIGGVEDLLEAPYNGKELLGDIVPAHLDRFRSLDGKRLVAMPMDAPPMVMYYRTDILEAAGFPSDPEELATFLSTEENLIALAEALKADGKLFLPASGLIATAMMAGSNGYFDTDLNYVRNTEKYVRELDLAKKIKQLELAQPLSLWTPEGQQAIQTGQWPILFSGSWLAIPGLLPDWVPDQVGKWKMTSLPLGNFAGLGGAGLAIPSQSKNKDAAWAFVKFATASVEGWATVIPLPSLPGYRPAWDVPEIQTFEHPFLQQLANKISVALIDKIPEYPLTTPLDAKADTIFREQFQMAVDQQLDSKTVIQQIETDVMAAVKVDRDLLLSTLNK